MKNNSGHFFEDFTLGQELQHATPRTVTSGDVALYQALYGSRFALQSSDEFARDMGYPQAPVDDLLAFHLVFGKSVPDISLNALANLGYAGCVFRGPVYVGDTLTARSKVIGLKENSSRQTGVVYVETMGFNQHQDCVLSYIRWVMVKKRDEKAQIHHEHVPDLPPSVTPLQFRQTPAISHYDVTLAGSPHKWADYALGEKIDHVDGYTVEEAEHQMATRLYQNSAKVHFNQYYEGKGKFGRRLIYGGHVMSLARSLSFNGLGNAYEILAINGGKHVAPLFAGDTVFAWSEVLEKVTLSSDKGALRLKTYATKNRPCADFPTHDEVILMLDYWVLMPL
jgi:2-methylfumaryl-CoA hydratase